MKKITPYKLVGHKVWDLKKNDQSYLKLDWNESTREVPAEIKEMIINQLKSEECNIYSDIDNTELTEAIAAYANVDGSNVLYFNCSDQAHECIIRTYLNNTSRVLILGPTYDHFRLNCEISGAKVTLINYWGDKEVLEQETVQYDLVYICNPNNPTGDLVDNKTILEISQKFRSAKILVDEAYIEFSDKRDSEKLIEDKNIIITRTMSKAFGIAGFRFGYIVTNEKNISDLNVVRNPKTIGLLSQIAGMTVLQNKEYMEAYVREVREQKEQLINHLEGSRLKCRIKNTSCNFILLTMDSSILKDEFVNYLYDKNVFVRDLSNNKFLENCVRITVGDAESMLEFIRVIDGKY